MPTAILPSGASISRFRGAAPEAATEDVTAEQVTGVEGGAATRRDALRHVAPGSRTTSGRGLATAGE
jgi:hypothetical protein